MIRHAEWSAERVKHNNKHTKSRTRHVRADNFFVHTVSRTIRARQ